MVVPGCLGANAYVASLFHPIVEIQAGQARHETDCISQYRCVVKYLRVQMRAHTRLKALIVGVTVSPDTRLGFLRGCHDD